MSGTLLNIHVGHQLIAVVSPRNISGSMHHIITKPICPQLMAVQGGYIDGAATQWMILKQYPWWFRCSFGHFWWPYGLTDRCVSFPDWCFLL